MITYSSHTCRLVPLSGCVKKCVKQVEHYKNKPGITYLFIAALLAFHDKIFLFGRHLCFDSGTKNDIRGQRIFSSKLCDIYYDESGKFT